MTHYEKLKNGDEKISVIGLGYVGMPIAVSFARVAPVVGFDTNREKIETYLLGHDPTGEVGDDIIARTTVQFTADEKRLREASFHIVAVPTPVNEDHMPNLDPLTGASHTLGRNLTKGSVVVYESTVYPGVTEEICAKILEEESGLVCGKDFFIGYSPERINPGDKEHRLENIVKVVSGMDESTLETIAKVYEMIVEAGVYKAESIKVAEAAKVIENSQRDINIAFMNELSIIFNKLNIDTQAVLRAAETKWNFLHFAPGLVGGHCIGVDPYYLTYKAEQTGYRSQVILAGRHINDEMGKYAARQLVKMLIDTDVPVKSAKVAILGLTFKEDCPDIRNTRVVDILSELKEYGISPAVCDPVADDSEAYREYGISLTPMEAIKGMDAVVIAVAHEAFRALSKRQVASFFRIDKKKGRVLADLKGVLEKKQYQPEAYMYWRF